MKIHCCSCS